MGVTTSNGYVKVWAPDHPLRGVRGEVLEHRVVLYDAIGPGEHACHWCGRTVTWRVRIDEPPQADDLVVDHLDGDRANNARENLAPSCQPCNVRAGYGRARIRDDETYRVRSGMRLRADERTCTHCGTVFLREPSAPGSLCSRSCAAAASKQDVCRRGHARTRENLTAAGQCRDCMRLAYRAYRERKRARA